MVVPAPPRTGVPAVKRRVVLLLFALLAPASLVQSASDDAPPTVRLLSPQAEAGVARTFTVTGTALDNDTGVLDVQVRVDGGPWTSAALGPRDEAAAAFSREVVVEPGVHLVEARATDGSRWSLAAAVTVLAADAPPPSVTLDAPAPGEGLASDAPATVAGRVDGPLGTAVRVKVDETPWREATVVGTAWTTTIPPLPPGLHNITVLALSPLGSASLPRRITVASAAGGASDVRIVAPEDGAGLGGAGEPTCRPEPCVTVRGIARRASVVALAVDGSPAVEVPIDASGAWSYAWTLAEAFEGDHVLEAAVAGGVPSRVVVRLGTRHALVPTLEPLSAPTGTPVKASVRHEGVASATWLVDGRVAASGANATLSFERPGFHLVVVRVRDAEGREGAAARWALALNRAPTAVVLTRTEPAHAGVPATFDGGGSFDPDGRVLGWAWRVAPGTFGPFQDEPVASATFARRGSANVSLVVLDDAGGVSAPATLTVDVPNGPPTSDFLMDRQEATTLDLVRFTDRASDPDGASDLRRWQWSFGDGATSAERHPAHRFPRGAWDVTLTVTDAFGASASANRRIVVANLAPVAEFSLDAEPVLAREPVRFRDETRDADGRIVSRAWDLGDGNVSTEAAPTHVYAKKATYRVTLKATDDAGATSVASRDVEVLDHPPIAALSALVDSADATEIVTFVSLARDPDGVVVRTTWTFGDGTLCTTPPPDGRGACGDANASRARGALVTHAFPRGGLYNVTLAVEDDAGGLAEARLAFRVRPVAPKVTVAGPFKTTPGAPVTLSGAAFDVDGRVRAYAWDVDGDGRIDAADLPGANLPWTYERAGIFPVTLFATDDEGLVGRASSAVVVEAPAGLDLAPRASVIFPVPNATVRGRVLFSGEAFDDRAVLEVAWLLVRGNATVSPAGGDWTPAQGTASWSLALETQSLANGPYVLRVRTRDGANEAFAEVPFVVANLPRGLPGTILTVNETLATADSRLRLSGTAWSPSDPLTLRFRLDEGPWSDLRLEEGKWRLDHDVARLADGWHAFTIRATSGERFEERSMRFRVEHRALVAAITRFPAGAVSGLLEVGGGVASDDPAARFEWRIDRAPWRAASGRGASWSLSVPLSEYAPGAHTLEVRAVALDGAPGPAATFAFEVAPPPPPEPTEEPFVPSRGVPGPGLVGVLGVALAGALTLALARRR